MAQIDPFDELNPYAAPRSDLLRDDVGPLKSRGIDLSRENPYLTIWTRPRATIRGILDTNPTYHVLLLAMLGGILQSIDRAAQRNMGDQTSMEAILAIAFILGPLFGIAGLYIGGALIGWSGRRWGATVPRRRCDPRSPGPRSPHSPRSPSLSFNLCCWGGSSSPGRLPPSTITRPLHWS